IKQRLIRLARHDITLTRPSSLVQKSKPGVAGKAARLHHRSGRQKMRPTPHILNRLVSFGVTRNGVQRLKLATGKHHSEKTRKEHGGFASMAFVFHKCVAAKITNFLTSHQS